MRSHRESELRAMLRGFVEGVTIGIVLIALITIVRLSREVDELRQAVASIASERQQAP